MCFLIIPTDWNHTDFQPQASTTPLFHVLYLPQADIHSLHNISFVHHRCCNNSNSGSRQICLLWEFMCLLIEEARLNTWTDVFFMKHIWLKEISGLLWDISGLLRTIFIGQRCPMDSFSLWRFRSKRLREKMATIRGWSRWEMTLSAPGSSRSGSP